MTDDFEVPDSTDLPNIHDGLGTNDAARRLLWDATIRAIEQLGLRIHGEISHGATAVVFEAKERQTGRRLALKVIFDPSDVTAMAFFRRECRILASDHLPNDLVPHYITGIGWDDDQSANERVQPFVVMELIDGKKIHEYALRNPDALSMPRRIDLVKNLFAAVHRLHQCNLLHGDLSSNNVLVEAGGRIRICDFGQSKRLSSGYQSRSSISGRYGTPGFAPNSQLAGEDTAAEWTDIRQASAIAFHMLTGEIPDGTFRAQHEQWKRSLKQNGVPSDVAHTVLRGLREKDPRSEIDRELHANAVAVVDELNRWESRRRRRSALLRQAVVFTLLLIPVAVVAAIGWQKYRAELASRYRRQFMELRAEVARLPHLDHPAISPLIDQADQLFAQQADRPDGDGDLATQQILEDAIGQLRRAIDNSAQIDRCGPIRTDLSIVLERTKWVTASPRIARMHQMLNEENLALKQLIENGDASQSWNRLVKFSAELAKATRENGQAEQAAEQRRRYIQLEAAIPQRLRGADGFSAIRDRSLDAGAAWEAGDWRNTELHYGQARQQLNDWFREHATPEELAAFEDATLNALMAMQAEIAALEDERNSLSSEVDTQTRRLQVLRDEMNLQTVQSHKDRESLEQAQSILQKSKTELGSTNNRLTRIESQLKSAQADVNLWKSAADQAHKDAAVWKEAAEQKQTVAPTDNLSLELLMATSVLQDQDYARFVEDYYPAAILRELRELPGGVAKFADTWQDSPTDLKQLRDAVALCAKNEAELQRGGSVATFELSNGLNDAKENEFQIPGFGDELPTVLKQAVALLDDDNVRDFVLHLYPESEVLRLQDPEAMDEVLFVVRENPGMIRAMLDDLTRLAQLTPQIQDNVAEYTLSFVDGSSRPIRFQNVNGHWRFFDHVSPARLQVDELLPDTLEETSDQLVRWERVGARWRLYEIEFLGEDTPLSLPQQEQLLDDEEGEL